jgi:hypothetical protein
MESVREVCLQKGLQLVVTREDETGVWARITHGSVPPEEVPKLIVCNRLSADEGNLNTCEDTQLPNFVALSYGVEGVQVSRGPYFGEFSDLKKYLSAQQQQGFRGHVRIQAARPRGYAARINYEEELQVTDNGIEVIDPEWVEQGRKKYRGRYRKV